ncbi:unnamed protein product [Clonostachys rosea]|uniref:Uncharacterized protein n=1 Tax=Bionectria ochroleuca TaxID=29856 RepID=A0ABY6UJN0_BIOOC|nr:unnamed protein product [Clonostachys rosea]
MPSGAAAQDTSLTYADDYLVEMYPKLHYLISICTRAVFPTHAGLYDGRAYGNNVTRVIVARYVIDGNIWSSSGARVDLTLDWVKQWYEEAIFNTIRIKGEYIVHSQDDNPLPDDLGVPHQC